MPVNLTLEMKKEIAGFLESGMKCFYHISSAELEWFPDEFKHPHMEHSEWEEVMEKIDEHFDEYLPFEGMESHESFEIMEDFINEIPDKIIQAKFANKIQRRKPFQQFKDMLFDYPELRQQWFAYKDKRYIEYIEEQVEMYNRKNEE
ncbi:MAG: hypothetical protein JWQ09_5571 [Segetibacter sp.]|nr:hypothetical protein [Segetibacter sp.]